MTKISRRNFLKRSALTASLISLPGRLITAAPFSRIRGANDDIRVAVIGLKGKGSHHIKLFRQIKGVRVVALCDVDRNVLADKAQKFYERKENVDTHIDVRDVLERKDVDVVVTATPNHWHSLITVWACQAGKDVYVEKPVSHNIWEGRKSVEAARKYGRIVQAGIQSRSDKGFQEAVDYIHKGNLGKILLVRGLCYKRRDSIGKVAGPVPVPDSVDYDLWTGPAELKPLMRQRLHYDWHWIWNTGNGDIGNQGAHEMDMCRRMIGQDTLPPRVISIGGRFGYDDDGQTPNTIMTLFDYEPVPIIFEVRGLPRKKNDPAMDHYRGVRIGLVVICENGYFASGSGGGWAYDNNGKKIRQFIGTGAEGHQANFIDAVRSRKKEHLNCDILDGHISSALCHLSNISYRTGIQSSPRQMREAIKSDTQALETFERFSEHLAANGIDLTKDMAVLGASLKVDTSKEKLTGPFSKNANQLLTREYRKPFVVPEKV